MLLSFSFLYIFSHVMMALSLSLSCSGNPFSKFLHTPLLLGHTCTFNTEILASFEVFKVTGY